MSVKSDVTRVPLHGLPSSPSYRRPWLSAPERGAGSQARLQQPNRVLIIEDDLLIAMQMETALAEAGFDVIASVTTGEEAIEVAGAQAPDLAVVDIRLAGDHDGIDTALELFRAHGIRCIFASAYADREARRRAEAAAPLGWLQKPYTMTSLTDLVRAAVREIRGKGPK
jgi:two-component system, response regulator PdtaR